MKLLHGQILALMAAFVAAMLAAGNASAAVHGTVVGWGENRLGESLVPANLMGIVAVSVGDGYSLALKDNGTVVAWGGSVLPSQSLNPTNIIAISAGGEIINLALREDGTVVSAAKLNSSRQQTVPTNLSGVVGLSAGYRHSLILKEDGTVIAWGDNESGQTTVPDDLRGIVALSAGYSHSLALRGDGTVVAWGANDSGQSTVPVNLRGVVAIAAGGNHSLALQESGTVVGWGQNNYGQATVPPGLNPLVVAISAGLYHNLALKRDGTVFMWGYTNLFTLPMPANLSGVSAVSANYYNNLALFGVTRPIGYPTVFVDGLAARTTNFYHRGSGTISLGTAFPHGTILYTLDGSNPDYSSQLYDGPFPLAKSSILRAMAYNADFTRTGMSDPMEVTILPTVNATTKGGGLVPVNPSEGAYLSDGTVFVNANQSPGWMFLKWLGDATGTYPAIRLKMSQNRSVQAIFGTHLTNIVVGSGSVVRSSAGPYPYGTTVRLTAVPQPGTYFALWGNEANSASNPLNFTITNANPTVTAVFATLPANQHALTVLPEGFGQVNASPRANRYPTGATVTLTAVPEAGQSFLFWSGDASGTRNPLPVTMNASKLIRANFTQEARLEALNIGGTTNGEEIQLLLTGGFDRSYVIEAATTLTPGSTDWSMIATVNATHGIVQINDRFVTNRTQRFYRVLSVP